MTYLEMYLRDPKNIISQQCPSLPEVSDIDEPEYCCLGMGYDVEICTMCWNREIPDTDPQPANITDAVNHPKHYGREGAMECIDEMLLVFGVDATLHFCLLNAWKYRYRAGAKGGDEDLRKSDWYLAKYKELKGGD